ncbi:MAG: hypothetical protein KJP00_07135 [Bacteroidia bacterium]|nr:hypothetical protein [Bacteroidia bacterium]
MHHLRLFATIWFLVLTTPCLFGQDVPLGQWKSYAPYHNATSVTQNATQVFFANELSIMILEKSDGSVSFLSKENGLSDSNIKLIKHSPYRNSLVVVYANSNLDLIKDGQVINLNFIKTNSNLSGDRSIHDIHFSTDGIAYLSATFGIVELNIAKEEFRTTIFTGVPVRSTIENDNEILAATDEGIYKAPLDGSFNIADFSRWDRLDSDEGFPADYSSNGISVFNGMLYVSIDGDLYTYDGQDISLVYAESGFSLRYLNVGNTHLIFGLECDANCNGKVGFVDTEGNISFAGSGCASRPLYAIQSGETIYYADLFREIRRSGSAGASCENFFFDSPLTSNVSDIEILDDQIYIASGGRTDIGGNADLADGLFFFEDGSWQNYDQFTVPVFVQENVERDFIQIRKHPTNGNIYIANYYGGLIEYDGTTFSIYNQINSSLQGVVGFEERERVGSIDFDSEGNIWMTNHLAERPISVFKTDGTWQSFAIPASTSVMNVTVDDFDNKWITINASNQAILVFNEGDFDNAQDDQFRLLTINNTNLTSNQVNHIVSDLDGIIWTGTAEGVVTFECGGSVFDDNCLGTRRIVEADGNTDFLLRTENVRTIGVDGGNRKWFGTTNGIFVQSPDGEKEVYRYTSDNSPLYNNNIIDFGFNESTGEVFIGSSGGVQSIRTDASFTTRLHQKQAEIFPNPVRPDFTGTIGINGLARDANVKITDVKGQLVYETRANGGLATWDGNDFKGNRVATGVYMVFSTVQDSFGKANTLVGKILFVN